MPKVITTITAVSDSGAEKVLMRCEESHTNAEGFQMEIKGNAKPWAKQIVLTALIHLIAALSETEEEKPASHMAH